MAGLPDLRDHVRPGDLPLPTTLVRGGPDTVAKLQSHAERLRRAFVLGGSPVLGISMFAALDDLGPASLSGLQSGRLSTYRLVHLVPMGRLIVAGFTILPTFGRPHMTVLLDSLDQVGVLLDLLGPPQTNPGYGETRHRRRG